MARRKVRWHIAALPHFQNQGPTQRESFAVNSDHRRNVQGISEIGRTRPGGEPSLERNDAGGTERRATRHPSELWTLAGAEPLVAELRELLRDVGRDVARVMEGERPDAHEPIRPPCRTESLCIQYGETEKDEVIVGTTEPVAVLTAPEIPIPDPFRELAPMLIGESVSFWKRFFGIGQSDEAGLRIGEGLETNPGCPLAPPVDPAGETLTTSMLEAWPAKRVYAQHAWGSETVRTVRIKSRYCVVLR